MTKADRIRELEKMGCTTREIADVVGCLPSYVRVVTRQRNGTGGYSKHDINYLMARYGGTSLEEALRNRYATPEFRERHLAAVRKYDRRKRAEARAS